jgi:hypothetical protein
VLIVALERKHDIFAGLTEPTAGLQLASTAFDHWTQQLCLILTTEGIVLSSWWKDGENYPMSNTNFDSGPSGNFSAIAMTTGAMFYGISGDQILEYSVDQTDPSIFHYVGVVFG